MTDANGWPDEARPGVPLNPEQDGWHWVQSHFGDDPECKFWLTAEPWWNMGGPSWAGPDWVASKFRYLGPCLTPTEHAATLAGLRDGSLVAVPKDVVGAAMYLARKHGATNTHTALALAIGFAATDQPA